MPEVTTVDNRHQKKPALSDRLGQATGSTSTGLLVLAVLPLIGCLLVFLGGHETRAEFALAARAK